MTDPRKRPKEQEPVHRDDVVLLKDLAPRDDVKGGRKMRFGEPAPRSSSLRKRRR